MSHSIVRIILQRGFPAAAAMHEKKHMHRASVDDDCMPYKYRLAQTDAELTVWIPISYPALSVIYIPTHKDAFAMLDKSIAPLLIFLVCIFRFPHVPVIQVVVPIPI